MPPTRRQSWIRRFSGGVQALVRWQTITAELVRSSYGAGIVDPVAREPGGSGDVSNLVELWS
jgi:hypothetical protein